MKNRLTSFAYLLPIIELLFVATIVIIPALLFFNRLKQMAHGSGSVSFASGEFAWTIPSDRFLPVAFERMAGYEANHDYRYSCVIRRTGGVVGSRPKVLVA